MISDHVYERNLTGDAALFVPAGGGLCFAIDFPHAADITKLVVKQQDGTPVGFTVNLYNRQVCALQPGSASSSAEPSPIDDDLAKVIPEQYQPVPGTAMSLFHADGYTFKNMEGTFTVPIKKIYLEIIPDAIGEDTLWGVALGGRPKF